MPYEAVLLDQSRGHHRRGTGAKPEIAVMYALRKILSFEVAEDEIEKLNAIGPDEAIKMVLTVNVSDELMEDPKTLREDIFEQKILVRVDRTKEQMFTPVGWIKPIY